MSQIGIKCVNKINWCYYSTNLHSTFLTNFDLFNISVVSIWGFPFRDNCPTRDNPNLSWCCTVFRIPQNVVIERTQWGRIYTHYLTTNRSILYNLYGFILQRLSYAIAICNQLMYICNNTESIVVRI